MRKFLFSGRKLGATAATAATFVATTVATLLSKSSNTVATLNGTLSWLVSRLKTLFNSLVSGSSGNTFPNSSQEKEHLREESDISPVEPHFPDSYELGDEYDYSDYGDWLDGYVYSDQEAYEWNPEQSWEQEAVDEAIDEEAPGEYPPNYDPHSGDIPW